VVRRGSKVRNTLLIFKSLPVQLARTIRIPIARHTQYKPEKIWGMAILTAMHQTSLEQTRTLARQVRRSLNFSKKKDKEAKPDLSSLSSPDTVLYHLHKLGVGELTKRFNQIITKQVKEAKRRGIIPKTKTGKSLVVALDTTNIPYYGKKKNRWILGCKKKAGTNWAYTMATAEIVDKGRRLCLGAQPVNQLVKTKKIVSRLVKRVKEQVKIRLLLLDRGFFSIEVIQTLNRSKTPWLMPVIRNKEIEKKTQAIWQEKGTTVVSHILGDKKKRRSRKHVEINLIIIPPPKKKDTHQARVPRDMDKEKDPSSSSIPSVFATNLDPGQGTEDWPKPLTPLTQKEAEALWAVRLGETYRKRWGIETGYRVKKDFRAKTCSVSPSIRFVFLFLSIILYNVWTLLNKAIPPDQYQQSQHLHPHPHPYNRTETPKPANLTITTTTLKWLYILIFSPIPLLPLDHWT
jgi:IS4 transposase